MYHADYTKQDQSRAAMMMLWFNSMTTSVEKVGKGILWGRGEGFLSTSP